ncbi:MAG: DUF47 domain-containing protein [Deltaproteobacteria bacterium]
MFHRFLPKEFNFFALFDKQVECAIDAAGLFKELVSKGPLDASALKRMEVIEHRGDEIAHQIIEHLNKTFLTPFDREDIHALTKELDDIIDMLNTIVSRLRIYKVPAGDKNMIAFAGMIQESVRSVSKAVHGLSSTKERKVIEDACVEINRLENVGDDTRDKALEELFEKTHDPITVIKLKEIYQDAETVLDICEDVTHVINAILLKQA